MGWDDGRVADCPAPALVLSDGNRAELSTDGQFRRVMLPTCPRPRPRAVRSLDGPRPWVLTRRRGVALRPAAIDPRRARPPTKVRSAPNDSAASGCGDRTSSCLLS